MNGDYPLKKEEKEEGEKVKVFQIWFIVTFYIFLNKSRGRYLIQNDIEDGANKIFGINLDQKAILPPPRQQFIKWTKNEL